MDDIKPQTVLFYAINTPGHINFLLALADKIKADHGYNTVFLLLGPTVDNSIQNHGHKLVTLEEENVSEAYEMSEDDDDYEDGELSAEMAAKKAQLGRRKVKLSGFRKYENLLNKHLKVTNPEPFGKLLAKFKGMLEREVIDNEENISAAIRSIDPDLIILDVFIVPPCILNLKHTPWVKLCSANPLQLTKPVLPSGVKPPFAIGFKLLDKARREKLRKEDPAQWEAMIESWKSASETMKNAMQQVATTPLQAFFTEKNCPPLPEGKFGHDSPHLNLYLYPKEIDYDQDDDLFEYPANHFRCDSMLRRPISQLNVEASKFWADRLSEGMRGKKEVVFFSLGSLASGKIKLMKKYVDIFKNDQQRLYVVSKGANGDKYELDPSNMIGGNYIPQTFFLEQANLAIVHGGNNSVFECLYFGVPMIVLPVFGDQNDNAQRIEDLGLGKRLSVFDCCEEKLLGAIDEILSDQSIIERAQSIGRQMRVRDTATKVSLLLKKLLEEKHLEQSTIDMFKKSNVDEIK